MCSFSYFLILIGYLQLYYGHGGTGRRGRFKIYFSFESTSSSLVVHNFMLKLNNNNFYSKFIYESLLSF
jgi:hypothetical protein